MRPLLLATLAYAVTIHYTVSGDTGITFSPAGGSITFQPFETAKAFPIQVSLVVNAPRAVIATLTGASGASIGSSNKYFYTVTPNSTASATKWINCIQWRMPRAIFEPHDELWSNIEFTLGMIYPTKTCAPCGNSIYP